MTTKRDALLDVVLEIGRHFAKSLPADLLAKLDACKTVEYYQRVLWRDVRAYYAGEMDRTAIEDDMLRLIDEQLTRAWNEGAREVGVEIEDMTEDDLAILEEIKMDELDAVPGFLDAIAEAAKDPEQTIDQFRARVDLWVNRYPDVANRAKVHFGGKVKLQWNLGATEEHCYQCNACNGIVAFAEEWEQSGLHPQSPPNDTIECQGWHCDCSLTPTDQRRSANALQRLMDIATSANV